ncbi:cupin domain-containing protein [Pseudoscourfieldia marina]
MAPCVLSHFNTRGICGVCVGVGPRPPPSRFRLDLSRPREVTVASSSATLTNINVVSPAQTRTAQNDNSSFLQRRRFKDADSKILETRRFNDAPSVPNDVPASAPPAATLVKFVHAPLSFFALDQMTYKGKRTNVDVGDPEDYTRPLVKDLASDASFSCGSWVCTQGGWDSPNHKKATEWFVVLSGAGAVTDPDGTRHDFRAGDVVVLPKGWYGRWDITEQIHKVWINDAHDDIPGASTTPVVASLASFAPHMLERAGTSPERLARTFFDNGRTRAGFWSCAPGSFPGGKGKTAECVHIIGGTVFLTNEDGSARRICAGDTVVLPDGWTGRWDVVERTEAVWASVTPP